MVLHSREITFAVAHGKALTRRIEILTVIQWENTTVFQDIWIVEKVDVIVPLGYPLRLVAHILDKVNVQRVPLAVFPIPDLAL